ncbi:GNAT family N-acetyltransferase [Paenibacillus sp. GSMTC-2017]|uniref:GNAT family N-acetyltransferase n=1 Tax=Paenibacillus sp. GSMTC-2017 TaxID=2794350 RepID=UPI0018D84769|nr:GNAT family N-acetyltransferase [Paenibacillus sp. GSMTC-2017]MBH5319836.1 GNAT family N-acetyltransferase [Paenibacillus sp. GSMTC-2017]
MTIQLRELRLPEDYGPLAELLNSYYSEPTSAQRLQEEDAQLYEVGQTSKNDEGLLIGYDRTRRVAVNEKDEIVGYLWTWRAPWTEPGYLNNTLVVAESYRNQGVGTLLLRHMLEWAEGLGASSLMTSLWDDNPESLHFATTRGFIVDRHYYQSVLDLKATTIEEEEIAPDAMLACNGLRLLTLADEPGEESERKLYELEVSTLKDIPGHLGDVPDYDQWLKWYLKCDGFKPELVIIAAHGNQFIGMTNVLYIEKTNGMYHEYTGVHRAYRNKKVAFALKLKAIELGKLHGADYIRTDNDSFNEPMLKINRTLGYVPLRGSFRLLAPFATVVEATSNLAT